MKSFRSPFQRTKRADAGTESGDGTAANRAAVLAAPEPEGDSQNWREELRALCRQELEAVGHAKLADRVDHESAGVLDVIFAYRLLLGRCPEFKSVAEYQEKTAGLELSEFVRGFLDSGEFKVRAGEASGVDLVVMRALPGMRLYFNLNDSQALRIAMGLHEPEIQQVMRQLLKPGMNCIDAGAHIGLYSMVMAQSGGEVWSFEPMPGTFELLSKNISENGFEGRVHATRAACHQKAGVAKLYLPAGADLGPAFIRPTDQSGDFPGAVMEVPMVTIDDIVPEQKRIGLVKMDIEGNEPFALRGMDRILERDRPILFTEFLPHAMGVKPAEHLPWLRSRGYELYEVAEFLRGERRPYEFQEGEPSTNLVCLPL
jgi:FkbM family methyltransferase